MQKSIKITKMHGLGNDFVVIDYEDYLKSGMSMQDLACKLCDRHFGVGADGMFIPDLKPDDSSADIGWFFYNSDGTIAQMCGNGIRCFAKYAYDNKLIVKKKFKVQNLAGIIEPEILNDGQIKVKMSVPVLMPEKIPFKGNSVLNFAINAGDKKFIANSVSMGNPHCIIFIDDNSDLLNLAEKFGPILECHDYFPEKTNVEFAQIISKSEIDMRVYERGCGITLACGTGACATVVAAILNNLTESKVKVNLLGGALNIEWQGNSGNTNFPVYMSGPAEYSFFADYLL